MPLAMRRARVRQHFIDNLEESRLVVDTKVDGFLAGARSSWEPVVVVSPVVPPVVVTSGDGGVFPPGILVGQIADFRTMGYGLYREARVSLAVKMNSLEEVWVKTP
jgi:hypothetical protein